MTCDDCDARIVRAEADGELLTLDATPSPAGPWVLDGLASFRPPGSLPAATAADPDDEDGRVRWRQHRCGR